MEAVMEYMWLFLVILVSFIGGALSHEHDMRRCIRKYGTTRSSGWLGKINGFLAD